MVENTRLIIWIWYIQAAVDYVFCSQSDMCIYSAHAATLLSNRYPLWLEARINARQILQNSKLVNPAANGQRRRRRQQTISSIYCLQADSIWFDLIWSDLIRSDGRWQISNAHRKSRAVEYLIFTIFSARDRFENWALLMSHVKFDTVAVLFRIYSFFSTWGRNSNGATQTKIN